ncbi:MAG: hypothetical protein KatS3mg032_1808 [Cyclobacteriaceae bacterium]|nr:MAG: hypothetical protein KatS3mg032_1808 [Cyclobacteriaceae bacterium]
MIFLPFLPKVTVMTPAAAQNLSELIRGYLNELGFEAASSNGKCTHCAGAKSLHNPS